MKLEETPAFKRQAEEREAQDKAVPKTRFRETLMRNWRALLLCVGLVLIFNVTDYMVLSYLPSFMSSTLHFDESHSLVLVLIDRRSRGSGAATFRRGAGNRTSPSSAHTSHRTAPSYRRCGHGPALQPSQPPVRQKTAPMVTCIFVQLQENSCKHDADDSTQESDPRRTRA